MKILMKGNTAKLQDEDGKRKEPFIFEWFKSQILYHKSHHRCFWTLNTKSGKKRSDPKLGSHTFLRGSTSALQIRDDSEIENESMHEVTNKKKKWGSAQSLERRIKWHRSIRISIYMTIKLLSRLVIKNGRRIFPERMKDSLLLFNFLQNLTSIPSSRSVLYICIDRFILR